MTFPVPIHRRHLNRRHICALLAGFVAVPGSARAQNDTDTDPLVVVSELIDAMQANDGGRVRAVFAKNASQAYGLRDPQSGNAFWEWLETDIIAPHGRVENPEYAVDGMSVVVTGQYRNDKGYSSAADFLFLVENGKIISWQMRY